MKSSFGRSALIGIYNFVLAMILLSVIGVSNSVAAPLSILIAVGLNYSPMSIGFHSGFITAGSEWTGKEAEDAILRPLFLGQTPKEMGIKVIFTVKSYFKLTFFNTTSKILKAYADGWAGGSAATSTQKKLELKEFKAEVQHSKQTYKDTVLENITQKGGDNAIDGTSVQKAQIELFMNGIAEDMRRIFWLGKKLKYTLHASGYYTSTPDTDYNVIDGIWTAVMGSAVAHTSATVNDVRLVSITNTTTAQKDTVSMTGSSGTANITVDGVAYLATFNSTLTQTNVDFLTTHGAALALRGITATASVADLIFTASLAGQPHLVTDAINVSGNLAGTVANTIANVEAAALGTDEALATMKSIVTNSNKVLKSMLKQARFYMTDTMIENYQSTLESASLESSRKAMVDGIERFTYRGIPIIPMNIDEHLTADFNEPYPHRAMLTVPENLCLVLNGASDETEVKFWFNNDENVNRQRAQFMFGADFILPELITVAY